VKLSGTNLTMIMGLEITCNMYSDVCLRYRMREKLLFNHPY